MIDVLVDKETVAIQSIVSSLASLMADEQQRVLAYVNLRYSKKNGTERHENGKAVADTISEPTPSEHSDVASLFEEARPQSCSERALVAEYWFQIRQSQKDFEARALTLVVAELGHPTKNITRDLRALLSATPKLMIQVGKGSTNTSHRYRLTTEGIRAVQKMIAGERA